MVIFGAISATLLRLLLESNILKLGKEGISLALQTDSFLAKFEYVAFQQQAQQSC
jgi:hypothetical protein